MRIGDARSAQSPSFDDTAWEPIEVPSVRKVTSSAKQTVVWIRSSFELSAQEDLNKLSLDLGARTGHSTVWLNGQKLGASSMRNAPVFFPAPLPLKAGRNVLAIKLALGGHVGGVRWTGQAALGQIDTRHRGMVTRQFRSAIDGSQQTIALYIPKCSDLTTPHPLLVALPGWDGNIHGFTHSRLMQEAEQRGWFVLIPDPRGNVLYTGAAEQGVLEAMDLVAREFSVDADRIFLTGVSMGGAGALQIGYHYPDRFAAIVAFYGDSRYEPRGYVRSILTDQRTADRYSVLLFHLNARNLPVLLVHARDDKVSAFAQSQMLADADRASGLTNHRLIAPDKGGHSLQVVEDAVDDMVSLLAASKRDPSPTRVSFKTSSANYASAYWSRVSVLREGEFGQVDLSVDRDKRTVRAHSIDSGVQEVTIDVAGAGLTPSGDLNLILDASSQASIVLTGLGEMKALKVASPAQSSQVPIEKGSARLPRLTSGNWKLTPEGN